MAATSNGKFHPDGAQALFHDLGETTDLGIALTNSAQKQAELQKDRIQKNLGRIAAKTQDALRKKQDEERLTCKLDAMEEAIRKRFDGGTSSA